MAVVFETIGKIVKGLFFEKQDKPLEQVLLEDIRAPKQNEPEKVKARRLLDMISGKEASGNYNAYYGNSKNRDIDFTSMTLKDVRRWQDDFVERKGSISSAVGRYQIIRGTLDGIIKGMGLTGDEKFTPELQDQMGMYLLKDRGYDKFVSGKLSKEQFANNLAKEWAAFPVVTPGMTRTVKGGGVIKLDVGDSYYKGLANNRALIGPKEVLAALDEELKLTRV